SFGRPAAAARGCFGHRLRRSFRGGGPGGRRSAASLCLGRRLGCPLAGVDAVFLGRPRRDTGFVTDSAAGSPVLDVAGSVADSACFSSTLTCANTFFSTAATRVEAVFCAWRICRSIWVAFFFSQLDSKRARALSNCSSA